MVNSIDFNSLCAALGNSKLESSEGNDKKVGSTKNGRTPDAEHLPRELQSKKDVPSTRETNAEKSERYRRDGNTFLKRGDYESALDQYSRALNCLNYCGDIQRVNNDHETKLLLTALCNRSAAHASLRRYADALRDAEAAVSIDTSYAKAHSRRALALFRLGRYEDAATSYADAIKLGTHADIDELEKNRKEALNCLARATPVHGHEQASSFKQRKSGAHHYDLRQNRFGGTQHVPEATPRQKKLMAAKRYEAELRRVREERNLAFARWKESTEIEAGPFVDERKGCTSVDVFGHLRGKCLNCNNCKGGWNRDANTIKHWSDKSVLVCSTCGCGHDKHFDCGPVQMVDPVFEFDGKKAIVGIQSAK